MNFKGTGWIIRHPGGDGYRFFATLDEALKLFEGFNVPRKVKLESMKRSIKRQRKRYEKAKWNYEMAGDG